MTLFNKKITTEGFDIYVNVVLRCNIKILLSKLDLFY